MLYYAASGTKGLLNGCGLDFWRRFGGCTTTYGDLCWPAGLEATRLTLGANKHNAPWDLANARLIIFWGKNTAETNIHQMTFVDQALDQGARLVVIDPRRTQTAERAELLIQPRPGTDGFLALAVARLILDRGAVDAGFRGWTGAGLRRVCGHAARMFRWRNVPRSCGVPVRGHRAAGRPAAASQTGHHLRRIRHAALHQQRPDHAGDHLAAGDDREHRPTRRRLDLRQPADRGFRRAAVAVFLFPAQRHGAGRPGRQRAGVHFHRQAGPDMLAQRILP